MLTERSIINFLIWVSGLIVGPYLVVTTLEQNYAPMLVTASVCALVFIFGFLRDRICVLPVLGIYLVGRSPFLPFALAPSDLCAVAVVGFYLIRYTALQRKIMLTGKLCFFIPIFVVTAILVYHEHSFDLRAMGGGREGGRGALFILISSLAYLCGVSINSPGAKFLTHVPFYCIVASVITSLPYVISTVVPATTPYLLLITNYVNADAYAANALGEGGDIIRNQGLANMGSTVMIVLICYYPLSTWWRPRRWWIAAIGLICIALVIVGGFRSAFLTFSLQILVAAICYSSWRGLVLVPIAFMGILFVTILQDSHIVHLPAAAQRSLAFLPGDWDPIVKESTESSNDFRKNIQRVYLQEEAAKSPLLGNGFSYDSAEFQLYNYLALTQETEDGYYGTKIFVTGKLFHIGWISVYDAVGLIGAGAFLLLALSVIFLVGRMIFSRTADRKSPLFPVKVWMFCNCTVLLIGYFTVFGDFRSTFPAYCYYAVLWTHLRRLELQGMKTPIPNRPLPFDAVRGGLALPA